MTDHFSGSAEPLLLRAVRAADTELMKARDLGPTFLTVSEKDALMRELVHLRTLTDAAMTPYSS